MSLRRPRPSRTVGTIESVRSQAIGSRHLRMQDLIEVVGEAKAIRLCRDFPGAHLPPLLRWFQHRRMDAVARRWRQGWDVKALSRVYGVSPITIRGIIRRDRQSSGGTRSDDPSSICDKEITG